LYFCFGGTGFVNKPSTFVRWIEYAKKMKHVDEKIQKIIFRKELIFLSLSYMVIITIYVVRKCGFTRSDSLYVGIPLGVLVNYFFTAHWVNKLSNDLKNAMNSEDEQNYESEQHSESEAIKEAILSHDRSLVKYSITALTTALSLMSVLSLSVRIHRWGPMIDALITVPASMLGFLIGVVIYKMGVGFQDLCLNWSKKRRRSSGDLTQTLV